MNTDLVSAVGRYVAAAIVHGAATEEGDYKRGNPAHDEVLAALREIREAGEEGKQALLELVKHENASVRCWAGTHLLKVAARPAMKVLRSLAKGTGLVAMNAGIVLEEWRKGTLETP